MPEITKKPTFLTSFDGLSYIPNIWAKNYHLQYRLKIEWPRRSQLIKRGCNKNIMGEICSKSMRDINKREQLRDGWIEYIVESKPRYSLTVTFKANSSEKRTRKALDHLIIRLNKAIYKDRYKNGLSDLKGVGTRERGKLLKKNTQGLMHCDHYHLIIFEGDGFLPDREAFRRKVLKEFDFISRDKSSADFRTLDLQDYYNLGADDLENYNTKIFNQWFLDVDYVADSIGPIRRDNVAFGRNYFETR